MLAVIFLALGVLVSAAAAHESYYIVKREAITLNITTGEVGLGEIDCRFYCYGGRMS